MSAGVCLPALLISLMSTRLVWLPARLLAFSSHPPPCMPACLLQTNNSFMLKGSLPPLAPQVDNINLKGLDRVIMVTQHPENKRVLFRQYTVRYKKSGGWQWGGGAGMGWERRVAGCAGTPVACCTRDAAATALLPLHSCDEVVAVVSNSALPPGCVATGTRVPRTELTEMGPSLDLEVGAGCRWLFMSNSPPGCQPC